MPEREYQPQPEPMEVRQEPEQLTREEKERVIDILNADRWSRLCSLKMPDPLTGEEKELHDESPLLVKAASDPEIRTLARSRIMAELQKNNLQRNAFIMNDDGLGPVARALSITVDAAKDPELAQLVLGAMRQAFEKKAFVLAGKLVNDFDIAEGKHYARTLCINALHRNIDREADDIAASGAFPRDLNDDPELWTAVRNNLLWQLDHCTDLPPIIDRFLFPKPLSRFPELFTAFKHAVLRIAWDGEGPAQGKRRAYALGMSDDEWFALAAEVIENKILRGHTENIFELAANFELGTKQSAVINAAMLRVLTSQLESIDSSRLQRGLSLVDWKDPEIQKEHRRALDTSLRQHWFDIAIIFAEYLPNDEHKTTRQRILNGAMRDGLWRIASGILSKDPEISENPDILQDIVPETFRGAPPELIDTLPLDFKKYGVTEEDRRGGATRVDAECYERVRGVRNDSLRKEFWNTMLSDHQAHIVTDAPFDRAKDYPRCPPHLFGALVAHDCASAALLRALDAYTEKREGKSGGTEAMQRLEFAVATIAGKANLGYGTFFRDVLPSLIADPVNSAEQVVAFLQHFAQLIDLISLVRKKDANEEMAPLPWASLADGKTTIEELARAIEEEVHDGFQKAIGVDINNEKLTRVETEWGGTISDLRSIIVLAPKYQNGFTEGLPLFRDTLSAIFDDRWHDFRYDATDATIAEQIGHLTDVERAHWIENSPRQGIGEVKVERNDTPERRREMLRGHIRSGLDQGHLTSYQIPGTSTEHDIALMLRGVLDGTRTRADIDDERRTLGVVLGERTFVGKAATAAGIDRATLETVEGLTAAGEQLQRVLATPLPETANAKAKGKRGFEQQLAGWVTERLALGLDKEKTIRTSLGITDGTNQKDLARLRDDRDLARDVARVIGLDDDELRQLNLKNKDGNIKEQDALRTLLTRIQTTLKKRESAFAQDIENIATALFTAPAAPQQFRDLIIEESDHPKTLFEAGHYPMGCGSCQNFEGDVKYTKCLLAYVADADKKILTIRRPDRTILARAIVKLGRLEDETKTPILFLEPTYTSVNKKDHDFDEEINRYMLAKAQGMGTRVRVLRGAMAGETSVRIAASRNYYQYEDGGAGAADNAGLGIKYGTYAMNAYEIEGQVPQSTTPEKRARAVRRRQGAREALQTPA